MIVSGRGGGGLGAYPSNISAGECITWEEGKGYQVDPDGYIYQWGYPTGKKQCQSFVQRDILPTVHSVPSEVMNAFLDVLHNGNFLTLDEASAQSLCRESQADESPFGSRGAALADFYARCLAVQVAAAGHWDALNEAWSRAKAFDDGADGAYTNGKYDDELVKRQIIAALQQQNHAPLAIANIQAAMDCTWAQMDYWVRGVFYQDVSAKFEIMQKNANTVAAIFGEVQDFLADLKANADRVTLSQEAVNAIGSAKVYLDDLTELATQIGALFAQARASYDDATAGVTDFANPAAVETAFLWFKDALAPFIGDGRAGILPAGGRAQSLAEEIHAHLDKTSDDLRAYIVQHPELGPPGAAGAAEAAAAASAAKKHTGLWLGVGGVGVLAILIKKGLLFA